MVKIIKTFPDLNIGKSLQFYRTQLNIEYHYNDERFAILTRDEAEIHLWAACSGGWKHTISEP